MKSLAIAAVVLALGVLGPQRGVDGRFESAWVLGLLVLVGFFGQQVAQRLRLPPLVGWLAAGLLLGPSGLRIVLPDASGTLGLLQVGAALWVGFHIGLGLSWPVAHRGWRLPVGIGLSAAVIFALLAAALVTLGQLTWAPALAIAALASLWGPFTAAVGVDEHAEASLLAVLGGGSALLLLSVVLAGLHGSGPLAVSTLHLLARLWLSLVCGGVLTWALRRARVLTAPIASAVGLGGSFALAALLIQHLQLYGLLFGFAAGTVLTWGEEPGPHLHRLLQAVHPMAVMLFFGLMGASIDRAALWPPLGALVPVLLLQLVVLVVVRSAGALLGYPLLAGGAGPSSYSGWLLVAKVALLFELVFRSGDTLRQVLAPEAGRLLYQVAMADILGHALLVWVLVLALGRRPRPAAPTPAPGRAVDPR